MTILQSAPDAVFSFAIVCSSFVAVSRGSTHRHYFLPLGDQNAPSVQLGNILMSRTAPVHNRSVYLGSAVEITNQTLGMLARIALAILLIVARGGTFVIEQPKSSLLYRHPRFNQLLRLMTAALPRIACFQYGTFSKPSHPLLTEKRSPGIQGFLLDVWLQCPYPKANDSVEQFHSHSRVQDKGQGQKDEEGQETSAFDRSVRGSSWEAPLQRQPLSKGISVTTLV